MVSEFISYILDNEQDFDCPLFYWSYLSKNKSLKFDDVIKYLDHPNFLMDMDVKKFNRNISSNPGITLDDIINNQDFPWDFRYVSSNPNISYEFYSEMTDDIRPLLYPNSTSNFSKAKIYMNPGIELNLDEIEELEPMMSSSPNLTMEMIEDNNTHKYSYLYLSFNPNLNIDFLIENVNKYYRKLLFENAIGDFSWDIVSANPGITMENIENTISDLPWNLYKVLKNKNLTTEFTLKHLPQYVNSEILSKNPNLNFNDIVCNPQIKWSYNIIAQNSNINYSDILNLHNIIWNYESLSCNPNIGMDIVESQSNKSWSFYMLSCNTSLTVDFLKKYSNKEIRENKFTSSRGKFSVKNICKNNFGC